MAKRKYTPRERLDKINAYNKGYNKAHYRAIGLQLNVDTQADVLAWIDAQPNKTAAIVELIRKELANK